MSAVRRSDLPGGEEGRGWRPRLRAELLAAVEVAGLTGLAVTRPVLDSFGRTPGTFVARDASPRDVVLFAVGVSLAPALTVAAVAAVTRLTGVRVRRWVHLAVVGALGAVVVWRLGSDVAAWGPPVLAVAGAAGGLLLVLLRWRVRPTATYLRSLGAASVVFLVQFLALSPASSLVAGAPGVGLDPRMADAVREGTGGDPPPVVMVVVDALSTGNLLDGRGRIDAGLFPNLAALADDATWYHNNTTVSAFTFQAVPALLSGTLPDEASPLPDTVAYPDNLFTLFAGTHEIEAVEQITRLCPPEACPQVTQSALPALLGDAADWWRGALEPAGSGAGGGGADGGVVDDTNVWTIDLLPTIADDLGIDLPWDGDGMPAREAAVARDPADKLVHDSDFHEIEPVEGRPYVALDGREGLDRLLTTDPVPGRGEHAVWQRTEHGSLVGRSLDDLDVGPGGGPATLAVEHLDRIVDQRDDPPMLEVIGQTGLAPARSWQSPSTTSSPPWRPWSPASREPTRRCTRCCSPTRSGPRTTSGPTLSTALPATPPSGRWSSPPPASRHAPTPPCRRRLGTGCGAGGTEVVAG